MFHFFYDFFVTDNNTILIDYRTLFFSTGKKGLSFRLFIKKEN